MVSFTYVPKDVPKTFQREVWTDLIVMKTLSNNKAFSLDVAGIGYVKWDGDSTTEYSLDHEDFALHGKTTSRKPWSSTTDTPESLLVNLPLPLHWHVHSLASDCDFTLKIPSIDLPSSDSRGTAKVHQEKNWANSFPSAHMWLQARDGSRGFCCAGGQILGMEAFLLGYRSDDYNLDFRPPFATRLAGISPFMSYTTSWEDRTFELSVQSFRQKIVVKASAPKGSFFSLSSPFPEGHRENYLGQTFQGEFDVKIYESGWFSGWELVKEDYFEGCSLEFGGGYYPPAGSNDRYH